MYNGGGGARQHWQNANNPNMAPLPVRPRPGVGAGQSPTGMPAQAGLGMSGPPGSTVGRPPMMGGDMMNSSSHSMGGMPVGPMPASAGGVPAHTTLFVGNISAGVTDPWLHSLLGVCGPLRSFKRVNASFGFAEYADPDSVLRALAVLAGQELPPLGASNQDNPAARKKLTVKADEKTRRFLDQYEQEKQKTEYDSQTESQARDGLSAVLAQMSDPANTQSADMTPLYNVPSHLKDLPPEELPEEHRGSVLSEIDKFRQASAARQEEKKRRERVQELERARSSRDIHHGPPQGSGSNGRPVGAVGGGEVDRQSYLRPVGFVSSERAEEEKDFYERDKKDEERRRQREEEDLQRAAHESERRFLGLERSRLAHWDREIGKDRGEEETREREAAAMRRLFEGWDQTREMERNSFYADRLRWRSLRKSAREREEREDEADQRAQIEEEIRAKEEAEKFLAQQAEDMAAFEAQQRAAGVLIPGEGTHAPLKLKVAAGGQAGEEQTGRQVQVGVLGNVEDESEMTGLRRAKLAHIDLHDGTTDDEKREERKRAVKKDLPENAKELFGQLPKWQHLDETSIEMHYKSLLDKGIVESIGESVPDMVDELIKKVRAHASADDLVGVVDEVLEEEAEPLIAKLWRELLIDTWSA